MYRRAKEERTETKFIKGTNSKALLAEGAKEAVLTVDGAQGAEFDACVVSFVRTGRAGFLQDFRRLNVALTRARRRLVLVGRLEALRRAGGALGALAADVAERGLVQRDGSRNVAG